MAALSSSSVRGCVIRRCSLPVAFRLHDDDLPLSAALACHSQRIRQLNFWFRPSPAVRCSPLSGPAISEGTCGATIVQVGTTAGKDRKSYSATARSRDRPYRQHVYARRNGGHERSEGRHVVGVNSVLRSVARSVTSLSPYARSFWVFCLWTLRASRNVRLSGTSHRENQDASRLSVCERDN